MNIINRDEDEINSSALYKGPIRTRSGGRIGTRTRNGDFGKVNGKDYRELV